MNKKIHVFVSGCYDVLHAGHLQFFKEAKALGSYLSVSFASSNVLLSHRGRSSSLPDRHKQEILQSIELIDEVYIGNDDEIGLDFKSAFLNCKPDILAVTEDDEFAEIKKALCESIGAEYVVLPKTEPSFETISTTSIIKQIKAPLSVPVRVDFAGGWLDVPKYAIKGAFIVNCAITPFVSKHNWIYEKKSGLGGSAAWAMLNGEDGVSSELNLGVGWQDPAIISETGLCAWSSGPMPALYIKSNPDFLNKKMALYFTGQDHDTPGNVDNDRDYSKIKAAGEVACHGVKERSLELISESINLSYELQLQEGMHILPDVKDALAKKYSGGGFGGYALYVFGKSKARDSFIQETPNTMAIEPYTRPTY